MLLTIGEDRPPAPWLEPQGNHQFRHPEFSPDGRYVAYSSNETGAWQVYIRPFQGDGPRVQISNRGSEPLWSPAGNEIFYRLEDQVIAVELSTTPALKAGKRTVLFAGLYELSGDRPNRNYDVTPDGQRFLMVKPNPAGPEPPAEYITVVFNWIEELQNRLRSGRSGDRPAIRGSPI